MQPLIPKLPCGAHLIDAQMPWAREDSPANTPTVIANYSGKYWNQALFSSDSGFLYGKPVGVHWLYAAPNQTIWTCVLQVTGGYWVPGKNDERSQGNLSLKMQQIAGDLIDGREVPYTE